MKSFRVLFEAVLPLRKATGNVTDSKEIPELLRKQVYSPVRFEQTLRKLITDGFDTFIEIGPGRTLTGFVKKTAKEMQCEGITCINIEKEEDLSQLITE